MATPLKDPTSAPAAAEFTKLGVFLRAQGITLAQAQTILGSSIAGRSRSVISEAVRIWLAKRPRA